MTLRRSCLSVPGNKARMIEKAAAGAADCVIIDLEDTVPHGEKETTRNQASDTLQNTDFGQKEVAVRINDLQTEFAYQDIVAIAAAGPDAIVIPKVESAQDVVMVDKLLTWIEGNSVPQKKITLGALIETARGIQFVDEISRASDRLTVLYFGIGDYVGDTGAVVSDWAEDGASIGLYPRSRVLVAATAAGLDAVDSIFPDYRDAGGLKIDVRRGVMMGFCGKWVIHPDQIDIVNEAFTPSAGKLRGHRGLMELTERARAAGEGLSYFSGFIKR